MARILVHLTARARRTDDEWDRLSRALDCLGALSRTKSGLEALIDEPWSARALACGEGSLLMSERVGPLSAAIGLLSAMAVYSAIGHNRVRAAVADLSASLFGNGGGASSNGGGALRALVEQLRPPRRPAQQYALQLVNALVSGPDDIGVRVQVPRAMTTRRMPCCLRSRANTSPCRYRLVPVLDACIPIFCRCATSSRRLISSRSRARFRRISATRSTSN